MSLTDSFVKKDFTPAELKNLEAEEERKAAVLEAMGLDENSDVTYLRRQQLSAEEAVIAKDEELTKIRQHKGQKTDWEEFVDRKRRMGRVMHHSEFIRHLRLAIPKLVVAPAAQRKRISLYVTRTVPRHELVDYRGNWSWVETPIYVGFIEEGLMPEYEVDLLNEVGVAVGQWRGWRTIVLRMIARRWRCQKCQQGERASPLPCKFNVGNCGQPTSLIPESMAERVFGHPTNGATASWYRKTLFEFRNGLR